MEIRGLGSARSHKSNSAREKDGKNQTPPSSQRSRTKGGTGRDKPY